MPPGTAPANDEARPSVEDATAHPGRKVAAAGLPALLLVAVSLWEIAAVASAGGRQVEAPEWKALGEELHREHKPGELIVFAPEWTAPLGRSVVGDLLSEEMVGRMDAARFSVVWEFSLRGSRAPETAGGTVSSSSCLGDLCLVRYTKPAAEVVTDFVADLGAAQQSGQGRARVSLEEVGFAPHRCIKAIPRPNQTITIRFPTAELGTSLVGYVGLADVFTRRDVRESGLLTVAVGGQVVKEIEAGVDSGWRGFSIPTTPSAAAEVSFALTAVGAGAKDRRICFAAEARR